MHTGGVFQSAPGLIAWGLGLGSALWVLECHGLRVMVGAIAAAMGAMGSRGAALSASGAPGFRMALGIEWVGDINLMNDGNIHSDGDKW